MSNLTKIDSLHKWGIFHAVLSTAFSSIAIIFQASATKIISPFVLAMLGNLIGGSILGLVLYGSGKVPSISSLKLNLKNLFCLAFLRGFLGALLFWLGLSLTLGVKAMFFTKAEPYFILWWDWLIDRRKVPMKHLGLLLVHIFGALLLSVGGFDGFGATQAGDLILIAAVAVLGLSYRFAAKLSSDLGVLQTVSFSQLIGGFLLLPIGLYYLSAGVSFENEVAWGYFFFSILLWNILGFSFWLLALREVKTWIVSSLRAIGPLVAAPIAYFCFDEKLSPLQILGGVIVLITSFLIVRDRA